MKRCFSLQKKQGEWITYNITRNYNNLYRSFNSGRASISVMSFVRSIEYISELLTVRAE
jgi:hypothetical protein